MLPTDYHTFPPVGHCIYCGKTDGKLSKEHIVPYALSGGWVLPQASCSECQKITQKFEEVCTHERWGMFAALRAKRKMLSRTGNKRTIATEVLKAGGAKEISQFEIDSFPAVAWGINLPAAGILQGHEPTNEVIGEVVFRVNVDNTETFSPPPGAAVQLGAFRFTALMQMLAKIGYAYAFAEMGPSFAPLPIIRDIILGKNPNSPYLVGGKGFRQDAPAPNSYGNRVDLNKVDMHKTGQSFFVVDVHLMADVGLPKYHVVVGRVP